MAATQRAAVARARQASRDAEAGKLREEVAFWKAETLEVRNVLADVVNDRSDLEEKAAAFHLAIEEMPNGTIPTEAFKSRDALVCAARRYGRSLEAANKKKNPKRKS